MTKLVFTLCVVFSDMCMYSGKDENQIISPYFYSYFCHSNFGHHVILMKKWHHIINVHCLWLNFTSTYITPFPIVNLCCTSGRVPFINSINTDLQNTDELQFISFYHFTYCMYFTKRVLQSYTCNNNSQSSRPMSMKKMW
jgi:hypothetical protein